jgi:hypothetical protein
MRKVLVSLCLMALGFALPAAAQMPAKSLTRIVAIKVKPGMAPQFEEGLKKFHQWEKQQNVAFTFHVWSIITGPRTLQYAIGTGGHDWKDFDALTKLGPAAQEQIQTDMGAYFESVEISFWLYRKDLSGHALDASQPPPAFVQVTTYFLKPGIGTGITDAIKAANAAIEKSHWPGKPSGWYSLVNGGGGPELAIVTGHTNWADFQPPETSFGKMLGEVYGKEGAAALGKKFFGGVRTWRSEIWRYRPDLSYIPASQ